MSRIVLVFLAAILTDALTFGQVNVEPNTALLNEGDPVELLCRYGRAINYCRIEIPGEQKVLNLSPSWSKTPGFKYYGTGLNGGQCGVSIERVKASNNGQVKCSLGVEGEELTGTIDLVVALRPQQPMIELLSKPNRDGFFSEGTEFRARCSVRDGRPPANISWYIDNMPANKRTDPLEVIVTNTNDNVELSTSVQEIRWHLSPEDSNRKLVCRSHHQTDRESVQPQEAAYIINVRYAPVHQPEASVYGLYLEHTAIVNITIRASPPPTIEWTIDGTIVQQGRSDARYSAYEPQYIGNDEFNVTLAIAGLTLEDTTKTYNLRASNELGTTDYQVRISSSSKPPSSSLDVAAIVGIVVAVAVLVLIVLLIVFARATGRWCFGGKSIKTPTNETSSDKQLGEAEAAMHGQNVALLETPNGITLLGASKMREANGNGHERLSVERRPHVQDEDDSFEYATDRESSVYNPTTQPLGRNVLMAQAGGRQSKQEAQSEENSDLLQRGNQLGIPESRFARWLPKDQRELLEKQAKLLSGRGSQPATVKPTPPAAPPKPIKNAQAATPTTPTTVIPSSPKLPQETEIYSDTESADIKATSTSTSTATATTTATAAGTGTGAGNGANGGEADGDAVETPLAKRAKRLPAFAVAILKRFNEKDGARKSKDNNALDAEQATTATATGANEQRQDNNATTATATSAATTIDGNDNEPKQDKQLVYAELVLKPAQEKKAAAAAATTPATTATATTPATAAASTTSPVDAAAKNATEYAEIVYVQKGEAKK